MKTFLTAFILALAGLPLLAQMPPAAPVPPGGINNMRRPLYSPRPLPNFAAPAAPGAGAGDPNEMIPPGTINFTSADVSQVLDIYSQLVNRTILRGNLPDAKIVLKTQTPLTRTEAIEALQAVLALNGIALIPMGDKFLKVLPSEQAQTAGGEIDHSGSTNLPDLGTYITHITQLKYVKPSLMVPILQPFAKLQNGLQPIDDNGILVMRDYAENIKRMLEMIEQIDVSVPAEYVSEVIPIRYAKVDDIASALNSLGGSGGSTVSVGTAPGSISGVGTRSTSVIGGFGGGGNGVSGGIGGGGSGGYQSGIGSSGSSFGARSTTTTPNGTPTTGTTFQQRLNNIINQANPGGGGGGGGKDQIQLFGQTKIIPNESSSTLLIYATREDMAMIKEIIAKLDVPLAQVLIEAVIMDVTLGNTFALGISAAQNPQQVSSAAGGIIGAGGVNNGQTFANFVNSITTVTNGMGFVSQVSQISSSLGTNGGAFSSALPGGLSYFANIGPNYDVALTAAESDSHASIIQQPRIQTSQAKPAQFFVGDTVPYVTGNTYGGAYGNSSSYSQLSVGVELDVTPFINPDGEVSMDIQQEIDDLNGYTDITGVGQVPNTIKRTLNTSITVRDRDTVMLGGFIKTDKSTSKSGVPFLSSIPLIGNLFSQRNDSKDREELIVLMRPTVLKTPELAGKNTIMESQRLPAISGAAAEDAEYEHNLEEAERVRELRAARNGSNTNGFYNILDQMKASETNEVPPAGDAPPAGTENSTPQNQPDADEPAVDPAVSAQAQAQADYQQKVNAQDPAPAASAASSVSPLQRKQLDAATNDWMAGKITTGQYHAMRDIIMMGDK